MTKFAARARTVAFVLGAALMLVANPGMAAQADADDSLVSLGGDGSATRVTVPVLGSDVVVPGDSRAATLNVRNDGESEGVLTVEIVNVVLTSAPDAFYDDFLVNGMPVSALEGEQTQILEQRLEVGEVSQVPLSYEFPRASTAGNDPDGDLHASFDVLLTLTGDTSGGLSPTGGVASAPGTVIGAASLLLGLAALASYVVITRRKGARGA